ncbi:MAG: M48 family metalloprotease [Longimicrobiales bacterium]
MRGEISRTMLLSAVVVLAQSAAGCATNPVTGQRQISLVSQSQEIQMGQQGAAEVEQSIGLVEDNALQQYVQRVGLSLAAVSERPELPWQFRVVNDPQPNAFALPGGYIFITRGLLPLMQNEAELATVLGHEAGHVTAKHSVTQISRAQLAQLGLGLGSVFVPALQKFGGLAGAGMQLLFLKYGRDDERQADELGFKYALANQYDVRQMEDVFLSLGRVEQAAGQSPLPTWESTHPGTAERIQNARARAAQLPPNTGTLKAGEAEYETRIDNIIYGENPREGFFRNNLFLHPDLKFQLQFPQGWKTQNTTQAVFAGSPQQDAIMQMTIARGTPVQAAQQFASQQGLTILQSSRETVNGNPAAVVTFEAATQEGVVRGLVGFVGYGGSTYQILGYTGAQQFATYQRLFGAVVSSFNRLTDPAALNAQPNRLDTIRLDRAMTLAAFNTRYPSTIPMAELAIINQVEGATSTMAAGSYAKRVTGGSGR